MKTRLTYILLIPFCCFLMHSCVKSSSLSDNQDIIIDTIPPEADDFQEITYSKISLTASEKVIADSINDFGLSSFNALAKDNPDSDIFYSPLSTSLGLSLLGFGAHGDTSGQIWEALGLPDTSPEDIKSFVKTVVYGLPSVDSLVSFNSANGIFISDRIGLNDQFILLAQENYDALVSHVDFSKREVIQQINEWSSKKTEGRIPLLLNEGIPDGTDLILLNAMSFSSAWGFGEDLHTEQRQFYHNNGEIEELKFFSHKDTCSYGKINGTEILELPYGDGSFSAFFFLPPEGQSFRSFAETLSSNCVDYIKYVRGHGQTVSFSIPCFSMENRFDLMGVLSSLGIEDAFDKKEADFGAMSSDPLFVSYVRQNTMSSFSEKGTVSAALTWLEMESIADLESHTDHTEYFIADRPFAYAIYESSSGLILFIGLKV